jgi:hypothetical protein
MSGNAAAGTALVGATAVILETLWDRTNMLISGLAGNLLSVDLCLSGYCYIILSYLSRTSVRSS